MLEEALGVDVRIAEGLLGFAAGGLIGGKQFFLAAHDAHAAAAASSYGFEDQGIADAGGFLAQLFFALDDALASGNGGEAGGFHFAAGAVFFAHHFDHFGGGANEGDLGSFADFGEIGVLREETVAGVNGVNIGDFRGADDLGNVEIALIAARRANADGFIRKTHVETFPVCGRVDGHRFDVHLFTCANYPQRNFSPTLFAKFAQRKPSEAGG